MTPPINLPTKFRIRIIRFIAALALFAAVCFLYVDQEKARAMQSAPLPQDLSAALIRAGLDAQSLTAAGLSAQQVTNVVNDVESYMAANPGGLAEADAAHAAAKIEYDRLQRLIQSGTHSAQDLTAFATATSQYNTTKAQRQQALDDIHEAGVDDLSETQQSTLASIRSSQDWETPLEFTVVNRSQEQWLQLREALAHERIALEQNDQIDTDIATLLQQLRADSPVSTAAANLNANSTAINTAWNNAVNN